MTTDTQKKVKKIPKEFFGEEGTYVKKEIIAWLKKQEAELTKQYEELVERYADRTQDLWVRNELLRNIKALKTQEVKDE